MNITSATKAKEIKRQWHLLDADNKILGRLATQIALLLMGKNKVYFTKNLDCGDHIVVINSAKIILSGKKELNKVYSRHSNYPGGFKSETVKKTRQKNPNLIIKHAVYGMLPKNKLRDKMMTRLYLFPDSNHSFVTKFQS